MAIIREATEKDEAALLELESLSPQGRGTQIVMDRNSYFHRSDLYGRSRVWVVEEDGRIQAVMACAAKEVLVKGEVVPVAYLYDMRAHPSYRKTGRRGPIRLWKTIQESTSGDGASLLYGHVKADNLESLRMGSKRGFRPVGEFEVVTFPTRPGRRSLAPMSDLNAVVEELEAKNAHKDLFPADIREVYRRGRELGYLQGVYRLAQGESYAQATVWDSSRISRGRVVRLPWPFRVLGWVLNPLADALPLPHIPRPGQSLRFWHVCDLHTGGPSGRRLLGRLLGQLAHLGAAEDVDLIAVFRYRDDRSAELPGQLIKSTLTYRTMALPLAGVLPQRPLYLDVRDV